MIRNREVKSVFLLLGAVLTLATACQGPPGDGDGVLLAYVANAGANHVQVVDLETGETLRKIYSGITPWRLVPAPDGRELWVQHWSSETTAVIGLEDHEVRATLPVRGPGIFDPAGERFLSFAWPSSGLAIYDARSLAELETRVTEVSRVHDLAVDEAGENLFLVQYDPLDRGHGERYAYLVSLPLNAERPSPGSVPTGRSPVQVLKVPGQPFLLTADSEAGSFTLLNVHGDGRTVPTCQGPQRLLLSGHATRLVVLCWDREAGRGGHAVSYQADFTTRPWPALVELAAAELDAGPVAGAFAPGEDRVWVLDQPGRRLLELDTAALAVRREIATGEVPVDVALIEVPVAWRRSLETKSRGRRRLEEALARVRANGAPFTALRWTETILWDEPPPEEGSEPAADDSWSRMETHSRQLKVTLAAPARLRRQAADEAISLAAGGWSLAVRRDGRFRTAPRQELAPLVYALPNFGLEEAVRRLAGDVPGSPYLAGGLAVDLSAEIREDDRRYLLIGALEPGQPVAQLWLDADTGRPTNLIEKFPVAPSRTHGSGAVGGFVETKLYDFVTLDGGVTMPSRLERLLDGRWHQEVHLEDVEVDPELAEADLDLARLGGFAAPVFTAEVSGKPDGDGPGRAVPVLEHGYLENAWAEHPPYDSQPPTSGPRLRTLADWGVQALPVPPELQVHNLEHGGVMVQYNCADGCPGLAAALARLTAPYERVIVAPYPLMEARIALTAWGRILTLDDVDEARITAFLDAWEGHDHHAAGAPAAAGQAAVPGS